MSLDIGQVLGGRYLVERLIGRGTMGCVYQARDQGNNQRIAIRLIQPDFDNEQVAAFSEKDARLAGQLPSKYIAKLANVGFLPTGERCILSEYVDGESLKNRILRLGPLTELQVAQMLIQLLEGLAAAHEAGVIHRDLTPRSVFLVPGAANAGESAKFIDFGISRLQSLTGNASAAQAAGIDTATLQYLSPEQLNGLREIDPRSNVYSLGVIAYEAITGRLPFEGQDFSDPTLAILTEEPPPVEELAPESSSPFAQLIRKAMARSPNARFQYAEEMIAAVTNWANRAGISQAQLEVGIGGVLNSNAVEFITQAPTSDISALSARFVRPSSVPAPAVPVVAPAAAQAIAVPPAVVAAVAPPGPEPITTLPSPASPPASEALAPPPPEVTAVAPPVSERVATLPMPDAIAAPPPPVAAASPFEAPPAHEIDQAHVDAMFAPPPAAGYEELPFVNMQDLAPVAIPPVAAGSSPVASPERASALIAPTLPSQAWQPPLETSAHDVPPPPPYDPIDTAPAVADSAIRMPEAAAGPLQSPPDGASQGGPAAPATIDATAPAAMPAPAPVAMDATAAAAMPAPAPAPAAMDAPAPTLMQPALVVPALVAPTGSPFENAATPAYGTAAAQPEVASPPEQAFVPAAPPAVGTAPEQAVRDARTILGIGGVAAYPVPPVEAAAATAAPIEGEQSSAQRPMQATAPGIQPGAGAEAQPPPQAAAVAAVASVPQPNQSAQTVAAQVATASAPAAVAKPAMLSPYDLPAPRRSRRPLVIAVLLVGIVGVGAAIAMSQGQSEPEPKASAAASQVAPPPRTFDTTPTDSPVAQAIAAAHAEASSKEASSASPKSGTSLSQAMNAGLSQSVAAAQKSTKSTPAAARPAVSAAKPAVPAAKPAATAVKPPVTPVAKPTPAAATTPAKPPAAKPPSGADPYKYR